MKGCGFGGVFWFFFSKLVVGSKAGPMGNGVGETDGPCCMQHCHINGWME